MTLLNKLDAIEQEVQCQLVDRIFPIRQTTNDVWGKYVVRLVENNEERYELETWSITVAYDDKLTVRDISNEFIKRVEELEQVKVPENPHKYICYQLCDWQFLRGEDGLILRDIGPSVHKNGREQWITLVKYARILKDAEEN